MSRRGTAHRPGIIGARSAGPCQPRLEPAQGHAGGRHAQLIGFKALDLFRSFGILSAGDPDSEKSTPEFLNDPDINGKVDYLFVGLGTHENTPTNRSVVFHQILERHRVEHDYYIGGDGGHDWGTWRAHLHAMLPKLWRAGEAAR
jgi:enterochelin esterase family protein